MLTTITINGVDYNDPARALAGFVGIDSFTRSVEDYDALTFTVQSCGPVAPFAAGQAVKLTTMNDDGSSPELRFVGRIEKPERRFTDAGWSFGYRAYGLMRTGDRVTLRASDGTGSAKYNLQPDDPDYLVATAGLTIGQIIQSILTGVVNAQALFGVGVGKYATGMGGALTLPPTLPAQTLTDLAALNVVPRRPVVLSGPGFFNQLRAELQTWMPRMDLWVDPDGTIRVADRFAGASHTLNCPTGRGTDWSVEDPIASPVERSISVEGCYAGVLLVGLDIQAFRASQQGGTLAKGWSSTNESTWTLADFQSPKGSSDRGSISTVTSDSVTVQSDDPSVFWSTNFWNSLEAEIILYWTLGNALEFTESRRVTNCTALTAGGSATIGWDSSLPITNTPTIDTRSSARTRPAPRSAANSTSASPTAT